MAEVPFSGMDKQGVVAINSPSFLRHLLSNLERGVVSVPLRNAQDNERLQRTGTTKVITPENDHGWLDVGFTSQGGENLAQISFTSGTEGAAKAVYLSAGNLHDVVTRLNEAMALTDQVREYIGVPVYHSFGYGRARAVLDAGGRCFIPEAGFSLTELRDMLRRDEINAISAVPSLWHVFLQSLDLFGDELQRVRWVEIGSQYMAPEDKEALRGALPNARIIQHYGLTEASRTTFQRIDTAASETLASVGSVTGAAEVRLDETGRVLIKGPHVAMGVEDGTAYRAQNPDDWFRTSDQGRLEDGLLYYEGRSDDVINLSGIKLSPDLAEAYVRQTVGEVGDFGILRRHDGARGEGILVVLGPDANAQKDAILDAVDAYAQTQGVNARSAIVTQALDVLPRTATGKLQRKAISALVPAASAAPAEETGFAAEVRACIGPDVTLDAVTNFHTAGGDSLSHLQMSMALERAFGGPVENWEEIPFAELIARARTVTPSDAITGAPPLPTGERNMNPPGLSFWQLVREDFRTNDASFAHQGFWMLFVHRFGNWRMDVRPRLLRLPFTLIYRFLNKLTELLFGMKLGYTVKVGRRVKLEHFGGMILGAREIKDDVTLRQNTTLGIRSTADLNAKPTLGHRVDVGAGAVIVGNIHIGDNSIIGANTVVFSNIPANSVVMGVPAKIIGTNPQINPSPLSGYDKV